jgi:hypothetical protein
MCKKYSTLQLVFATIYTNDSYTSMLFDPPFLHNFPIKSLSYTFKSVTRLYLLITGNLMLSNTVGCN